MNVLVVGGGGGIGAALLERCLEQGAAGRLLATHVRACEAPADSALHWLQADLTSEASIDAAAARVRELASELNLVLFATGYLHSPEGGPEKSLAQLHLDHMAHTCAVNALGPMRFLAGLERPLRAAPNPRVVMLSAMVGSIEDNQLGGWYGYRMAKAALNMGVRNAAIEAGRWRNGASIVALHPGTTLTGLSKPFVARRRPQPSTADDAAQRILAFAETMQPSMSGGFYKTDGSRLPW